VINKTVVTLVLLPVTVSSSLWQGNRPASADEISSSDVTISSPKAVFVPSTLPWSKASLLAASRIISEQKIALESDFASLRAKGNTSVKVIYGKQPLKSSAFSDTARYGTEFLPWRLVGNRDSKNDPQRSRSYPLDKIDIASYLTKPASDDCSLKPFSFVEFSTWFQSAECRLKTPSASAYLAASLATALKKSTLDVGSFELSELKYALTPGTHLSLKGDSLMCPELAPIFGGSTRIPLRNFTKIGGYSFTINLKTRNAKFYFLGPDLESLARSAYKNTDENFIRFF
jgi:hypothetical protein